MVVLGGGVMARRNRFGVWVVYWGMSKAVVDPGELRRFALELRRFNDFLQQQGTVINARMSELGRSWRDQEHLKFAEEFDITMKQLMRFTTGAPP